MESIDDLTKETFSRHVIQAAHWVATKFQLRRFVVSVSVVDDATIQVINRKHLQHDWPTDVISFVFETGEQSNGEIITSWDTSRRLSNVAGWSPHEELLLYIVHGLLHLVGLDDQNEKERSIMRLTEQEYLLAAGFPGASEYLNRFDTVSY